MSEELRNPIAYTFVRRSYIMDSSRPFVSSKAELYKDRNNCSNALVKILNKDYAEISKQAELECWAHRFIDIDECSGRAEYEIRGYETADHDSEFVVLYQYMIYPIYNCVDSDRYCYRGYYIEPRIIEDPRYGITDEFIAVDYSCDYFPIPASNTISGLINNINNFIEYLKVIGMQTEKEEEYDPD